MNKLLLVLFMLPVYAFSQDCNLKKVKDQFSQQPKLTTGLLSFNASKNPFQLTVDVTATDIDFLFSLSSSSGSKCFDDASTATINFDGTRSRLMLRNSGTMNCDGYFHFTFKNTTVTNYNLQRLANQKVSVITFKNDKDTTEVVLNDEQKQQLQQLVNCVIKQAPSMRQP